MKKVEESVAKSNRTEMLLKKLSLETFVKNIRRRMLLKKVPRKCGYKQPYPKFCSENGRSKRSSKIAVTECCQKSTEEKCH